MKQNNVMKVLKLDACLTSKLGRLPRKSRVGVLSYAGVDLNDLCSHPTVAVVGTRKPTSYGKRITEQFVQELARAGVVIVSGLALGVDALAHENALKLNCRTVAVLPSGLDTIYPATNRPIAQKILQANGALISEYSAKHQPRKVEFLERNRIIAALSDAVFIPEAAAHSGSLNTASHAMKMNIPVFATPGNINNPMSMGTNHLLKLGAQLALEPADILNALGIKQKQSLIKKNIEGSTAEETIILKKIALGFIGEELVAQTMLEADKFQMTITMLEIEGTVMQDSLGIWHLK